MQQSFISRTTVLIAMCIMCIKAIAFDFKSGDLCYDILSTTDKTVCVTYEKNSDTYIASYNYLPSQVNIPPTVKYNGVTWTVSQIGDYSFRGCRELQSITIPSTIQAIGVMAFESCTGITSIHLPASLAIINYSAFHNCSSLKRIECDAPIPPMCFGSDVFKLNSASNNSAEFCQVFVPGKSVMSYQHANGWRDMPINSFSEDASTTLYFLIVDSSTNSVMLAPSESTPYYGDIIIPESFVYDGTTFHVTGIWQNALADCTNLTSIVIPDCVTYIGDNAFLNCQKITSIKIPVNVSYIGTNAFKGCLSLKTVDFFCRTGWSSGMGGESSIWRNPPFAGCPNISEINIGSTVEEIPDDMFKVTEITQIIIPDNVRVINSDAFASCPQLKEITIGKNVEKLTNTCFGLAANEAGSAETLFFNATNLKEYSGNQSYWYPFLNSPLKKIVFGENVESLPKNAFNECQNLESITISAKTPPTCESNCFTSVNKLTCVVYVPRVSLSLYKNAPVWKTFANIQPIEEVSSSLWYIPSNEIENTSNAQLDIYMKPVNDIVAFQCDVKLPDGISIASDNDNFLIDKGTICNPGHIISANKLENSVYRIVCYSFTNKSFNNEGGKLFTLHLNCTDASIGNHEIEISNIHISDNSSKDIAVSPLFGTINIQQRTMIKGDANGDGSLSIADAVTIANKTLGKEVQSFVQELADVNADGIITISDAVGVINLILYPNFASNKRLTTLALNSTESSNSLFINDFNISTEEDILLDINLANSEEFTAFQFDMELPEGLEVLEDDYGDLSFELTDRADRTHMIASAKLPDGKIRVLSFSTASRLFSGSTGALVRVKVLATKEIATGSQIKLSGIRFTTDVANEVMLPDSFTEINNISSGIDEILSTKEDVVYFNLQGLPVENPSHGIFIEKKGNKIQKIAFP